MERLPTETNNQQPTTNNYSGVALVEILIAVAVGGILITGAALLISTTLRVSSQNKFLQAASFLSQDLMGKVTVFAEKKWYCPDTPSDCGIYQLEKGSDKHYYLSGSPFSSVSGDETPIVLDGVSYTRYFYLENVSRDTNGDIEPAFEPIRKDSSTQKVTVVTSWPGGGEIKIIKYLTRNKNDVFVQTDWQGGAVHPPEIVKLPGETIKFHTKANIDANKAGSIELERAVIGGF